MEGVSLLLAMRHPESVIGPWGGAYVMSYEEKKGACLIFSIMGFGMLLGMALCASLSLSLSLSVSPARCAASQ